MAFKLPELLNVPAHVAQQNVHNNQITFQEVQLILQLAIPPK